jgi:hypothetical protein
MQDRSAQLDKPLATHGRTIHRVMNGIVVEVLIGTPNTRTGSPQLARRQPRATCGHCMARSHIITAESLQGRNMVNLPFQFFTNFPVLPTKTTQCY